jgi:flagellar biosynthesis protein FlhA
MAFLSRYAGMVVPLCIIVGVVVVIIPLPALLIDLLLSANIAFSTIVLLTTTQIANPLQFSIFPSLLLGATLGRLVLNIATTRLILTRAGEEGTTAAGGVVEAFGHFVSSGSIVVGLILFLILVVVQFLVITRGASRISEVAARFALDGMPGRQAAIDADLSAGMLSSDDAHQRRQQLSQAADFYGAMDGASRFVRGDAIAGLVITAINIAGGLGIGLLEHGMPLGEALSIFTILTIGDGLVSQLPAFLIALAAGLLVTRTSVNSDLARDTIRQTFAHPPVLYSAALLLCLLAFTGLPVFPMLLLAALCGAAGWMRDHRHSPPVTSSAPFTPAQSRADAAPEASLFVPGETEPVAIELGLGLLACARSSGEEGLVGQLGQARLKIADDLGFVLPRLRIRDNLMLGFKEFRLTLDGIVISSGTVDDLHEAVPTIVTVVSRSLREFSYELLSRQQVCQLIEHVRLKSPSLVADVIPQPLSIGQVHGILCLLLREQVSIRNLEAVLGALADASRVTSDAQALCEAVREVLGRSICRQYCRPDGTLPAITLDPLFEASLADALHPGSVESLIAELEDVLVQFAPADGERPIFLCRADLRSRLRDRLKSRLPQVAVISRRELRSDISIRVVAEIGQNLLLAERAIAA